MNCCCCVPGKVMLIVAAVASLAEIICAAVYNFHTFGFVLGLLCMAGSVGFFIYLWKLSKSGDSSIDENENS